MSHLIETYALQTGAKIAKPFIIKNFFPTPDKYITIHNSSGMGGKNYDFFQDVIDEIKESLEEIGVAIIQIGTKEDIALDGCFNLEGKTDVHQTAFIIENSLLHVGNDSFPIHLASASGAPIVGLYSITTPEIAGPCFSKNHTCLVPDYKGGKQSFDPNENPKTVNTIKVEDVVAAIYKYLGLENKKSINSLFIGNRYKDKVVEFVPNSTIRPDFASNLVLNMRVDMIDNPDKIDEGLILFNIRQRKFAICMSGSKKIKELEKLAEFKNNIVEIFIDVTDDRVDLEYVKKMTDLGMKPRIVYRGDDEEYINKIKIDFLDLSLSFLHIKNNKEELDKLVKIMQHDKCWVKTNRVILSDGKVYLSEAHLKAKQPTTTNFQKVQNVNTNLLAKEADFLYFYSK